QPPDPAPPPVGLFGGSPGAALPLAEVPVFVAGQHRGGGRRGGGVLAVRGRLLRGFGSRLVGRGGLGAGVRHLRLGRRLVGRRGVRGLGRGVRGRGGRLRGRGGGGRAAGPRGVRGSGGRLGGRRRGGVFGGDGGVVVHGRSLPGAFTTRLGP